MLKTMNGARGLMLSTFHAGNRGSISRGFIVLPTFPVILENFNFALRGVKHIVLSSMLIARSKVLSSVMKQQSSYILILFTT